MKRIRNTPCSLERKLLPEYRALTRFRYSIFGSLDFASSYARAPRNDALRTGLFRQLIVETSRQTGIHRNYLQYFVTDEWSIGGEKHLHFVMPETGKLQRNRTMVAKVMTDIWQEQIRAGHCKVMVFDNRRTNACLRYVCKRQFRWDGIRRIELEKEAHISKQFQRWMKENSAIQSSNSPPPLNENSSQQLFPPTGKVPNLFLPARR